jgi:RimJ/RimL family protein N-acetyltransferase
MLRPMSEDEYACWYPATIKWYADDLGPADGLTPDRALEVSKKSFHELLPDGLATGNQYLWSILDEDRVVGSLWMGPHPNLPAAHWIWGIEVGKEFRSQGLGGRALAEAEQVAVKLGSRRVELNVFDVNESAMRMYRRLGYTVVTHKEGSMTMGKNLTPTR